MRTMIPLRAFMILGNALSAPDGARSHSAECATGVEALVVGHGALRQLFFQSPPFGFYLAGVIVANARAHVAALEGSGRAADPRRTPSRDGA